MQERLSFTKVQRAIHGAGRLSDSELRELAEIQAGLPPDGMMAEKRRVRLKQKSLAHRDDKRPWKWHLTRLRSDELRSPDCSAGQAANQEAGTDGNKIRAGRELAKQLAG
jgi:hypothetical protein